MTALEPGHLAPPFELPRFGERVSESLETARGEANGLILAFYKAECPTCQLAIPYLDRLARLSPLPVFAIAENDAERTRALRDQLDLSLPTLLEGAPYATSDAYGLSNVPTVFLLRSDGVIEKTVVGFQRGEYEALLRDSAALAAAEVSEPLFLPDDDAPELRPG